jgi:AcrR family transcriptional regulator
MRRSGPETRRRIVEAAYELFYRKGFARSGVDAIAAKAGVTKRTLYSHFASKDDLLAAALRHLDGLAQARIRKWGDRLSGDLDGMLDMLFADLAQWAEKPRWAGAGFTRLVMELADLPGHPARAIARRHKLAVVSFLAMEFAERQLASPEKRAQEVMLLLEGAMSLMLVHGDRRIAVAAAEAAKRLIRS